MRNLLLQTPYFRILRNFSDWAGVRIFIMQAEFSLCCSKYRFLAQSAVSIVNKSFSMFGGQHQYIWRCFQGTHRSIPILIGRDVNANHQYVKQSWFNGDCGKTFICCGERYVVVSAIPQILRNRSQARVHIVKKAHSNIEPLTSWMTPPRSSPSGEQTLQKGFRTLRTSIIVSFKN